MNLVPGHSRRSDYIRLVPDLCADEVSLNWWKSSAASNDIDVSQGHGDLNVF